MLTPAGDSSCAFGHVLASLSTSSYTHKGALFVHPFRKPANDGQLLPPVCWSVERTKSGRQASSVESMAGAKMSLSGGRAALAAENVPRYRVKGSEGRYFSISCISCISLTHTHSSYLHQRDGSGIAQARPQISIREAYAHPIVSCRAWPSGGSLDLSFVFFL